MIPTRKLAATFLIVFLIGGILGCAVGFGLGIKATIKSAMKILPYFANVTINEEAINMALFQYENRIGGCGFTGNAPILYNERD